MSNWFARPVLFVTDIARSVDFYVHQLGFVQSWRYEGEGKAFVAQVERQNCALILSSQWPDKVGRGLIFISLDVDVLHALRSELEQARGQAIEECAKVVDAYGTSVEAIAADIRALQSPVAGSEVTRQGGEA